MWKAITKIIRSMKSNPLRKLVSMIYRENKDILLVHPASVKMHHNYRSGFIEHVLSMAEIADQLAVHYQLDRDLLFAGVFLHDIGKIIEISSNLEAEYTDEGNFIGHIVIGRDIVRSAAKKITNFPEDVQIKLEHMILSHQGEYEWQSPKKPKISPFDKSKEIFLKLPVADHLNQVPPLFPVILLRPHSSPSTIPLPPSCLWPAPHPTHFSTA